MDFHGTGQLHQDLPTRSRFEKDRTTKCSIKNGHACLHGEITGQGNPSQTGAQTKWKRRGVMISTRM
jgi:hypothetical protein